MKLFRPKLSIKELIKLSQKKTFSGPFAFSKLAFCIPALADTPYDEHARCTVYGGKHFQTFDGLTYNYPGKGTYTLFEDCQTINPVFRVHINLTSSCREDEPGDCDVALKVNAEKSMQILMAVLQGE